MTESTDRLAKSILFSNINCSSSLCFHECPYEIDGDEEQYSKYFSKQSIGWLSEINKHKVAESCSSSENWGLLSEWLKKEKLDQHIIIDNSSTVEQEKLESQTVILTKSCQEDTELAKSTFVSNFLLLLYESDFEFGYKSQADDYVEGAIDKYGTFAREWINEVFLQNIDNPSIITPLLRVISHFDYEQILPQGITIAAVALSHCDVEVKECGVRCFENWESSENLPLLKNLEISEEWLNDYVQGVIQDLENIDS